MPPLLNPVAAAGPPRVETGGLRGVARVRKILAAVCDPEIPVLTIEDLGILRSVELRDGRYVITITPTYIGCPAMQTIEQDIRATLERNGVRDFTVATSLSPAWSTDWLSERGREKLLKFGIAPPVGRGDGKASRARALTGGRAMIACPQCGSTATDLISEFGSTACKALYRCETCREPFEYFKCL